MNKKNNNSLIIFGRYPRPGKVKTRLAACVGDQTACIYYKHCLEHIFDEAEKSKDIFTGSFYYSDPKDTHVVKAWVGHRFACHPQVQSGLIERNLDCFQREYARGSEKIVIIATDVPDFTARYFVRAFVALDDYDLVIGPDNDGGYNLLGMKTVYKELFAVEYGRGRGLFSQITHKAEALGLRYAVLDELLNIDTIADIMSRKTHKNTIKRPDLDAIIKNQMPIVG